MCNIISRCQIDQWVRAECHHVLQMKVKLKNFTLTCLTLTSQSPTQSQGLPDSLTDTALQICMHRRASSRVVSVGPWAPGKGKEAEAKLPKHLSELPRGKRRVGLEVRDPESHTSLLRIHFLGRKAQEPVLLRTTPDVSEALGPQPVSGTGQLCSCCLCSQTPAYTGAKSQSVGRPSSHRNWIRRQKEVELFSQGHTVSQWEGQELETHS